MDDEQYQALQNIYLKWHDGKRPLSGFINDVQEYIAAQQASLIEKLLKVADQNKQTLYKWDPIYSHNSPKIEAVPVSVLEAELRRVTGKGDSK